MFHAVITLNILRPGYQKCEKFIINVFCMGVKLGR